MSFCDHKGDKETGSRSPLRDAWQHGRCCRWLLLAALCWVAVALLLPGGLQSRPPQTIAIGQPGDSAYLANMHEPEQQGATAFRWSGPATRLVLPHLLDGPLRLHLRINGDRPDADATPAQRDLTLLQQGAVDARFSLAGGWRTYALLLPAHASNEMGTPAVVLELATDFWQPGDQDPRYLGVPLDTVAWQALPHRGLTRPVLQTTLLLLGSLTLILALFLRLGHTWPRWLRIVLAGALTAGLLIAVWLSPYQLTRLLLPPLLLYWPWLAAMALIVFVPDSWSQQGSALLWQQRRGLLVGVWLLAHLVLLAPVPLEWRGLAAWVLLLLPGGLLALLLYQEHGDGWQGIFVALCGGLALLTLIMLALHPLPGPLPGWALLLICDGLTLLLGWHWSTVASTSSYPTFLPLPYTVGAQRTAPLQCRYPAPRVETWDMRALLLVLLLAAAFRLPFLGSAEFQGDEGLALLAATGMRHGQDDVLLLRPKGPGEVVLPAAALVLTGQINEWVARLPLRWQAWAWCWAVLCWLAPWLAHW
ncbi:MAG: hypothetical protein HC837_10565 [Chloroflexaceae bacterium]|nr:hypothetical protein [Chloroflexaceae bacterium]